VQFSRFSKKYAFYRTIFPTFDNVFAKCHNFIFFKEMGRLMGYLFVHGLFLGVPRPFI